MIIEPIGIYRTKIKGKFGLPRQSGLASSLKGTIIVNSIYRDGLRGLEDFDYLWLIWGFDQNTQTNNVTVRPPRLGGNRRVGVFASRSPFRPNGLGLSSVKILSIRDFNIEVSGADLADGTPIYDIKPYIEYADSHTGVRSGFVDEVAWKELEVKFDPSMLVFSEEDLKAIKEILSSDPRPQYHNDPSRIYKFTYDDYELAFTVSDNVVNCKKI